MAKLNKEEPVKKEGASETMSFALPRDQRIQTAEGWKRSQLKKRSAARKRG
ncbi:MAG: hypothetical protein LW832_04135 [Parachlamydia sp.]|jgi:hypothetical protein|nr:hypothetical protein [Parachlamydia sp.]